MGIVCDGAAAEDEIIDGAIVDSFELVVCKDDEDRSATDELKDEMALLMDELAVAATDERAEEALERVDRALEDGDEAASGAEVGADDVGTAAAALPGVRVTGQIVVAIEISSVVTAPFPGQSLTSGAHEVIV